MVQLWWLDFSLSSGSPCKSRIGVIIFLGSKAGLSPCPRRSACIWPGSRLLPPAQPQDAKHVKVIITKTMMCRVYLFDLFNLRRTGSKQYPVKILNPAIPAAGSISIRGGGGGVCFGDDSFGDASFGGRAYWVSARARKVCLRVAQQKPDREIHSQGLYRSLSLRAGSNGYLGMGSVRGRWLRAARKFSRWLATCLPIPP